MIEFSRGITGLGSQPNFPNEDLTDENADVLEFLLANQATLEAFHVASEESITMFRYSHTGLMGGIRRGYDRDRLPAINHGIMNYEVIASFVQSSPDLAMDLAVVHAVAFSAEYTEPAIVDYTYSAFDSFRAELPRKTALLHESSRRFFGNNTEYVVTGAALVREFQRRAATIDISN